MLSTNEIAIYLQSGLDKIGSESPELFGFSILAECGRGYEGGKVNGVVKTVSTEFMPCRADYTEAKYEYAVELFVSGPEDFYFLSVNEIINKFIKRNQAQNVTFKNGNGVVTFTKGTPKEYKTEYGLGEGVPLTFTVHVAYTENGVSSGDKHWLLDGVEIPFLSESVSVEREGVSRKIYTEAYSKILLTGQTKFYMFRIPYESETFKSLQTEILQAHTVNQTVHTLVYYDGAAFTKETPFTAKVSIYKSASSTSAKPDASVYDVTFTDVWNAENQPLKYELALIDFPFDMQGDDTRYFNSVAEQSEYFEEKVAQSSAPFVEIPAPNLDGVVITKQIYSAPAPSALSQFDYASKNYAVIKVTSAEKTYYFYYFIENSAIGADGQVLVDLKMDTVQTYFFREDISFSDCLIERAHLNRFVPVEGDPDRVKFVTDPASKIYNSEEGLNFPKRLVDRQKLKLRFTGNDEVDEWLNENVAYWVYVFIDPSHEYKLFQFTSSDSSTSKAVDMSDEGNITYPIRMKGAANCICYPIYKGKRIKCAVSDSGNLVQEIFISSGAIKYFEENNNDKSFYYSIKISMIPPFDIVSDNDYSFNSDNNLVLNYSLSYIENAGVYPYIARCPSGQSHYNYIIRNHKDSLRASGLFLGSSQIKGTLQTFEYSLSENAPISKSDITTSQPPNLKFNHKLNSQNFKELVISASNGDTFAYDIQKLNDEKISFEYTEPITPEITKYYLRVKGGTGLYEDGTDENYTGLVGSTDNGLAYTNDQYANFIANNKNFFMQSNLKISANYLAGGLKTVEKAFAKDYVSAVTSAISAKSDLAMSLIDRSLTIDNLKNAPDQLKNANGNVIFNLFTTDLGLYVEKHEALEGDLKTANDFMNLYGFTFSAIDNVRDYVHIRKYHNYIKAQLQSINGNLSNVARADLRQRFANGIRFWNSDKIDYSNENFELWLDSGATSFEEWLLTQKANG